MNSRPYCLVTMRGSRQTTVPWSVRERTCLMTCVRYVAKWV